MKSPEETMLWHSGDGRECIASITGWREPVDYYFKNFLPVWKSAVTGRHFDRLNFRSRFDAILPLNHAIGLGVDKSLANAWRIGALLDLPRSDDVLRPFAHRLCQSSKNGLRSGFELSSGSFTGEPNSITCSTRFGNRQASSRA